MLGQPNAGSADLWSLNFRPEPGLARTPADSKRSTVDLLLP